MWDWIKKLFGFAQAAAPTVRIVVQSAAVAAPGTHVGNVAQALIMAGPALADLAHAANASHAALQASLTMAGSKTVTTAQDTHTANLAALGVATQALQLVTQAAQAAPAQP